MEATITAETKRYLMCPECSKQIATVDHLLGKETWTRWACHACGKWWNLQFRADGSLDISPAKDSPLVNKLIVLEMAPRTTPVRVILRAQHSSDTTDDQHAYYYDEHTCLTNWLGQVEVISADGDHDPHGLFRFRMAMIDPDPASQDVDADAVFAKLGDEAEPEVIEVLQ